MTTLYQPDPCAPPITLPDTSETIRERLYSITLRKALPWLVKAEMSPSTCPELRDIIKQIEHLTQ